MFVFSGNFQTAFAAQNNQLPFLKGTLGKANPLVKGGSENKSAEKGSAAPQKTHASRITSNIQRMDTLEISHSNADRNIKVSPVGQFNQSVTQLFQNIEIEEQNEVSAYENESIDTDAIKGDKEEVVISGVTITIYHGGKIQNTGIELRGHETCTPEILQAESRRTEWYNNPMSRWEYAEGADDFKGHDIMQSMLDEMEFHIGPSSPVSYNQVADEYGYVSQPPARISDNYMQFKPGGSGPIEARWSLLDVKNGRPMPGTEWVEYQYRTANPTKPPIPENQIESKDWCNLTGLTLDERKSFLDEVQKIIDANGYGMNARQISYSSIGGLPNLQAADFAAFGELDRKNGGELIFMIAKDSNLMNLLAKSTAVRSGILPNTTQAQQYTIKVTDKDGNRLDDNQIIVVAGDGSGRELQISVDQYNELGRKGITELLL